jgi:hypothetical protein
MMVLEEFADVTQAEVVAKYRLWLTFADGTAGKVIWQGASGVKSSGRFAARTTSSASKSIPRQGRSIGPAASIWLQSRSTPRPVNGSPTRPQGASDSRFARRQEYGANRPQVEPLGAAAWWPDVA